MANRRSERRKSSILEAVRSLAAGPLCYATNKEIALKTDYSPDSLSIQHGLEVLEGEFIDRYFETGTGRRFYLVLDHPEAGAVAAAIEREEPGAPRARRYSTGRERQDQDDEETRRARNRWLIALESCRDIRQAWRCTGDYLADLPNGSPFKKKEDERLAQALWVVEPLLDNYNFKISFLHELTKEGLIDGDAFGSCVNFEDNRFVKELRAAKLDVWAEAIATGNWCLLAASSTAKGRSRSGPAKT
ncbi:MAG TPA: hypothetical protein VGH33_22280 [Isosphaeraceae bacterium]